MIEKGPGEIEFFRDVGSQGFDAEGFSCVVTAVEDVETKFFRHGVGPVWAFASDEGVHAFVGRFFQIAAGASSDDADATAGFGAAGNDEWFCAGGAMEAGGEFGAGDANLSFEANGLAVIEEERAESFEAEGGAELGVIAEFAVRVEGKMRTIDGEVVPQQQLQQFVTLARPGMGCAPEESVMDNEEIGFGGDGELDRCERGIDRSGDVCDGTVVLNLEAVEGPVVVFYFGRVEEAIAVVHERLESFRHRRMKTEAVEG